MCGAVPRATTVITGDRVVRTIKYEKLFYCFMDLGERLQICTGIILQRGKYGRVA